MITIGLTTWSDHQSLMPEKAKLTLADYAGFFPVVEIDSLFYGLKTPEQIQRWVKAVPAKFQFVIKALSVMTRHERENISDSDLNVAFRRYRQALGPMIESHQLKSILCQFPPYFRLESDNVRYLVQLRQALLKLPIAVEFRNPTWYAASYLDQTVSLMKRLEMTLVAADEPQTNVNSVPFYPVVTNPKLAMIRLHGRNMQGWLHQDRQWRAQRTLYRYSETELTALAQTIRTLAKQAAEVCVIFNNNSGGDAADNALQLQKILGLDFDGLAPRQMDLF